MPRTVEGTRLPESPHQLWWRPTPRHAWRPVGPAGTEQACVNLIGAGGRHNGEWYIRPEGRPPDGKVAGPESEAAELFPTEVSE